MHSCRLQRLQKKWNSWLSGGYAAEDAALPFVPSIWRRLGWSLPREIFPLLLLLLCSPPHPTHPMWHRPLLPVSRCLLSIQMALTICLFLVTLARMDAINTSTKTSSLTSYPQIPRSKCVLWFEDTVSEYFLYCMSSSFSFPQPHNLCFNHYAKLIAVSYRLSQLTLLHGCHAPRGDSDYHQSYRWWNHDVIAAEVVTH